jgi:transposase
MAWRSGQAYAQDLRDRVLRAEGSNTEVAARFEVSQSYVSRVRSRERRLGLDTPGAQRNHVVPHLAAVEKELAAQVAKNTSQTLKDLVAWAHEQHGVQTSITAMWGTLRRLGLTLKKSRCAPASSNGQT